MSLFKGNRDKVCWDDMVLTDQYQLYVVDIDRSESNKFGVARSVNMINNNFAFVTDEIFSIDITFIKADYNIEPTELEDEYLEIIARILFKHKEPKVLVVGSKIYYGIFIDGSIKKINKRGYFTVTFQSVKPTAFGAIENFEYYIDEDEKIYIGNEGLYDTYADIIIECIRSGRISLINNEHKLEANMNADETIKIYGDSREVFYEGDIDYDIDALKLITDINEFNVAATGKFKVIFEYQPELPLV